MGGTAAVDSINTSATATAVLPLFGWAGANIIGQVF
jgi:hypothetical protein